MVNTNPQFWVTDTRQLENSTGSLTEWIEGPFETVEEAFEAQDRLLGMDPVRFKNTSCIEFKIRCPRVLERQQIG